MSSFNYPRVGLTKDKKVFVSFYIDNKRYRLFNGTRINSSINPNSFPIDQRMAQGNLLASEVYRFILSGGVIRNFRKDYFVNENLSDREFLLKALQHKIMGSYSKKYKKTLRYVYRRFSQDLQDEIISHKEVQRFLNNYKSSSSYNTIRRHLGAIISEARSLGMVSNPMMEIKPLKVKARLNKPFKDVSSVFKEVFEFNEKLGICCLLTYGCLLRPHREVRELTWDDFSDDLKQINLSGSRNKSGHNRIVPVPFYVQDRLTKGEPKHNIFTGTDNAPNPDYFKTIWGRFKKISKLLDQDQTLYSFRHSGAIEIYKRTGSLPKLQKAMGHSSLAVTLTYLRGLEVAELEVSDMPCL